MNTLQQTPVKISKWLKYLEGQHLQPGDRICAWGYGFIECKTRTASTDAAIQEETYSLLTVTQTEIWLIADELFTGTKFRSLPLNSVHSATKSSASGFSRLIVQASGIVFEYGPMPPKLADQGFFARLLSAPLMVLDGSMRQADESQINAVAQAINGSRIPVSQLMPVGVPSGAKSDDADLLRKLDELYRSGVLTQAEYESKKQQVLRRL